MVSTSRNYHDELNPLANSVQGLFRSVEAHRRRVADDHGVTVTELRALSRIAENSGVSLTALAVDLELRPSSVSTLVDGLVVRDLLTRRPLESDRRQLVLELSPQGHGIMSTVYGVFENAVHEAAAGLAPEQRAALAESVDTITAGLAALSSVTKPSSGARRSA